MKVVNVKDLFIFNVRHKQFCLTSSVKPYKAHWLLHVPPVLTYQNSAFCPQSEFVFGLVLTVNTVLLPKEINRLAFVAET
jgi:hypothetical protein